MSRMMIKFTDRDGSLAGCYFDAITRWHQWGLTNKTAFVFGEGNQWALVHMSVPEFEKVLKAAQAEQNAAEAYGKVPEPLDLRDISGKQPQPPKVPKEGLAKRFHLKR